MDYIKQRITKRLKSMTKISRVNRIGQKVRSLSACLNDRLTEDLNRISGPLWCRRKAGLMQKYVLAKIGQETIPTKAHCRLWDHYFELIRKSISRKKDFIIQKFSKPCKGFGPWSSLWKNKEKLIKERSPYSSFDSLVIRPMIVKSGDDLRQESLALNLIRCMKSIFDRENCNLFIHPYDVIIKNHNSGFIGKLLLYQEFIPDTISIDSLKKKYPMMDLNEIFREIFHTDFEACQLNFLRSLAGYSLVTYILKIKDRHNGNILMDAQGHIIHIDFGFMLSNSPGNWDFESAPFKLTEVGEN